MKELFIDLGITQSRAALYINGKLDDLYVENHDEENLTGNIYKGRIENIVPGLNAAFVNIGIGKNAILHFEKNAQLESYKKGMEILVQVSREASGDKGPRVTEEISLPGNYIVVLPFRKQLYISHKIKDKNHSKRFEEIFKSFGTDNYGVIFRTEAENISSEQIIEEYEYLKLVWSFVWEKYDYIKPPKLLFDSRDFLNYILREYVKTGIDSIYVNRSSLSTYIQDNLKKIKKVTIPVEYNSKDFKFSNSLSNDMIRLQEKRIGLGSGGYLYIESTEALTTIDVNTGSFIGDTSMDETILNINLEACIEIYKAIKLLNISGIILIDFINMKTGKNRQIIMDTLRECFSKDRLSNNVYNFTHLGFLEMARAKKGKSLKNLIYDNPVTKEYNISYILKEIENKCVRYSAHYSKASFDIYISEELYKKLYSCEAFFISNIFEQYNIKIKFIRSDVINNYMFDRDMKQNSVNVLIDKKIISGTLVEYREIDEELVNIIIKKA